MTNCKIRWIGQSGYILDDGKTEICIDPYLSNVVERIAHRERMVEAPFSPENLKCNVVICTHNHLDHLDIDAIPLMQKKDMLFLAPSEAKDQLFECGVTKFEAFDESTIVKVGDFELTAVYADHTVPAVGVLVKYGGIFLYFSGDTQYNVKLNELAEFAIDIMFICINGKLGNMNVEDAIKLTKIIDPKVAVPTHYGMFESNTEDPQKYISRVKGGFEMEYNKTYDVEYLLKN